MGQKKHLSAIELLKEDHKKVKALFEQFEKAEGPEKKEIIAEALRELKIHTAIEEVIFYPAVRSRLDAKEIMNEADEEHHVVKLLTDELETMRILNGHFEAKFIVLAENVKRHIQIEEKEIFPKARKLHLDLDRLGREMAEMKNDLNGVVAHPMANTEPTLTQKVRMSARAHAHA